MIKYNLNGTATCRTIERVYRKYKSQDIMLVMPNTKQQSVEELAKIAQIYPNITFSVTGGLDPSKHKFDCEHYQKRTYYTPMELSKIVGIYREIEKGIDISWTETQKAMYIYKTLCERMQYGDNWVNGRDCTNGIRALLYNKAVCSGFAMIYKEALDRQGIENYYQNRQHAHSWNIAKLDGKYRGIELTWDTSAKEMDGCKFEYFNRNKEDFYSNVHHDISRETEERRFPITPYTDEEIAKNFRVINKKRIIRLPIDVNGKEIGKSKAFRINDTPCEIHKKNTGEIGIKKIGEGSIKIHVKSFRRKDGSHFLILSSDNNPQKPKKQLIIEERDYGVKIGSIFSEQDLTSLPEEYNETIANGLLRRERLKRKIEQFNGYVGYIGENRMIYYSQDFERDTLNEIR